MRMEYFAESLAAICSRTTAGTPDHAAMHLRWAIISNPNAGGFKLRSRWKQHRRALDKCRAAAQANPLREGAGPVQAAANLCTVPTLALCGMIPTNKQGSAADTAKAIVSEAEVHPDCFFLIITAGGDGTSLEVLSVMYHASEAVRSRMAALRLPMGTGNDGSDSPKLANALDLLIQPSRIVFTPALRLHTASGGPAESGGPYLAFNILSIGLDAFVTHMTNKMKGKLPGDFYKLWVDLAALLYERLYTVGILGVQALDEQGTEVTSFREKILLLAIGVSGYRTYGSQKKILPDKRNVCVIKQMSLFRKLVLKELFSTGKHVCKPEAILFNAHRVEISGEHPILAQMDGEAVLLQCEDFPAVIKLTQPAIPVLKSAAKS